MNVKVRSVKVSEGIWRMAGIAEIGITIGIVDSVPHYRIASEVA